MTSDEQVLRVLRQAIDRVGLTNLARRPGLARNVLGDVLPDDPRVVALLSTAAEQGVVGRLQEQPDDDLEIVAPRLAEGLASSRGLVPEQARWAVDVWAAAMGRTVHEPAPTVVPSPPGTGSPEDVFVPDEQVSTEAGPQGSPSWPSFPDEDPTRAPNGRRGQEPAATRTPAGADATPAPQAAEPQEQTTRRPVVGRSREETRRPAVAPRQEAETRRAVPAPQQPAPQQPAPQQAAPQRPPRRAARPAGEDRPPTDPPPRRRLLLVLGAAAVVVALALVALPLLLPSGKAEATSWARTAVVQPKGPGVAAMVGNDMSEPLGSKKVRLRNGGQVQVKDGPVEIRLGDSAVRLDSGTTVSYIAGTARQKPLLTMTTGQVWVTVAKGQQLALRSPSSEHADLESGRFVAKCDNSCIYETIDERQIVHTGGFKYTMKPHQRFVPSTASTEPMDSQMGMSTASSSPDASGGMTGMDMNAEPDPNDPQPEFIASDILRNTPWIRDNVALDKKQGRDYASIGGRRLLGDWTVMLQRTDVPADVHRKVSFSLAHCDVATCALTGRSTLTDPAGRLREVRGWVRVDDAKGDVVKITYDPTPAACTTMGRADGKQEVVDNLEFEGSAGSGTRVTAFEPGAGSSCTSPKQREVTPATIAVVGHKDITTTERPFTSPGPVQTMVLQHVRGTTGSCSAGKQQMQGESADATCRAPSAASGGPKTIAYYAFPTTAALRSAYDEQVVKSKQRRDSGNCKEGACERDVGTGRRLIYGDAFLVETDERSRMMIIATGSVRSQLAHWRPTARDFSFSPMPIRGL